MKSIQISGIVNIAAQANQTAADAASLVFLALVLDKQTNGAQLNSEDVYHNQGADGVLAACPLRDMNRSTRFQVLKTWRMQFDQPNMSFDATNVEQGGAAKYFECYVKLDQKVEFTASAGTVADISDNSLHMIGYTSNTGLFFVLLK